MRPARKPNIKARKDPRRPRRRPQRRPVQPTVPQDLYMGKRYEDVIECTICDDLDSHAHAMMMSELLDRRTQFLLGDMAPPSSGWRSVDRPLAPCDELETDVSTRFMPISQSLEQPLTVAPIWVASTSDTNAETEPPVPQTYLSASEMSPFESYDEKYM